jgi:hypothetical protein
MSTLSIHPVEYLKLHLHYKETRKRFLSSLSSLAKRIFNSSEQATTVVVVLMTVGLVLFACMKITESAMIAANYDAAIIDMILPPLHNAPTGI